MENLLVLVPLGLVLAGWLAREVRWLGPVLALALVGLAAWWGWAWGWADPIDGITLSARRTGALIAFGVPTVAGGSYLAIGRWARSAAEVTLLAVSVTPLFMIGGFLALSTAFELVACVPNGVEC